MIAPRNPRAEATARLPVGFEGRVLEPSPPAVTEPPWFADDPTDPGDAGGRVVTPIPGEGITWTEMVADDVHLTDYAADHWLAAYRRREELPAGYTAGRRALHQLAFFVVAPKRFAATGKLGLRFTRGGFGTPFFGEDEQVRVEGASLVDQRGDRIRSTPITTLRAAAQFLGVEYREDWFEGFRDPLPPLGPDAALTVDPTVSAALGDWFGFATSVLEEARRTPGAAEVSRVQLWPEHFDPAFEMGAGDRRASYGASPGDDAHPEPYVYVSAWGEIDRSDSYWNAPTFNGASLPYRDLLSATDQRAEALAFLRRGYEKLAG